MKYKIYLNALMYDKQLCKFMKTCGFEEEEVGARIMITFHTEQEPTKEYIQKVINIYSSTKNMEKLNVYFTDVRLDRIELVEVSK